MIDPSDLKRRRSVNLAKRGNKVHPSFHPLLVQATSKTATFGSTRPLSTLSTGRKVVASRSMCLRCVRYSGPLDLSYAFGLKGEGIRAGARTQGQGPGTIPEHRLASTRPHLLLLLIPLMANDKQTLPVTHSRSSVENATLTTFERVT